MGHTRWLTVFLGVLGFSLVASSCGDADFTSHEVRKSSQEGGLDYAQVDRGVGVRSGDFMAFANFNPSELDNATSQVPHAMLRVKAYDVAATEFGEFLTYPAPSGVDARTAVDFKVTDVQAGRLANRTDDLVEEVSVWGADAGASEFESLSVAVDFWRWRQDWWVRWDGVLGGNNERGQGNYGFNDRTMVEDLLDDVESIAQTHQPRYLILGEEMERLLQTETTGGIAPAEISNFMAFYQEALERVGAASPDTQVGVGFRWDRFVDRVAPLYAGDDRSEEEALQRAFQVVLLPFIERSDIVALSAYPDGDESEAYASLGQVLESFEIEQPVVYYELGVPIRSSVDYPSQANTLSDFAAWNAGINVEYVAWRSLLNLDGTDTNDQMLRGRCDGFTSEARGFEVPTAFCFDGLYTSLFGSKPVFSRFVGE